MQVGQREFAFQILSLSRQSFSNLKPGFHLLRCQIGLRGHRYMDPADSYCSRSLLGPRITGKCEQRMTALQLCPCAGQRLEAEHKDLASVRSWRAHEFNFVQRCDS